MILNRSIPISLYATQHTYRGTSIPQSMDASIFNDLQSKIYNTTAIQESIFFNTNVNTHQSTNISKCKYQIKLT